MSAMTSIVDMGKLHELLIQGLTYEQMAISLHTNEDTVYRLVKQARAKEPEKWPKRTRKAKPAPVERKAPVSITASFPPLPLRGSEATEPISYKLPRDEVDKAFAKVKKLTNADGLPYNQPTFDFYSGR